MTVKWLMEYLSKLDQDKQVLINPIYYEGVLDYSNMLYAVEDRELAVVLVRACNGDPDTNGQTLKVHEKM